LPQYALLAKSISALTIFLKNLDGFAIAPLDAMENSKSEFRQRTERLQERTFEWAARIIDLCPRQYSNDPSRTAWRQLIRSAPSASSTLEEADEAYSDAEFLYKMKSVLKETNESRRWLRFITRCELDHYQRLGNLPDEAHQLAKIFATIYINRKRNVEAQKAQKR
jgi:four helix bundle protein